MADPAPRTANHLRMDAEGNIRGEEPKTRTAPTRSTAHIAMVSRVASTGAVMPVKVALPESVSQDELISEWNPEHPLPSHIDPLDDIGDDISTVRVMDGALLSMTDFRIVDPGARERSIRESAERLRTLDPDYPKEVTPTWQALLRVLDLGRRIRPTAYEAWYGEMWYTRVANTWFSAEECLVGLHKPVPNSITLRKFASGPHIYWRGGGRLYTTEQVAATERPASWTTRLLKRVGL